MILIAHRGNITGPNPEYENSPMYIDKAILLDFSVEVDLWIEHTEEGFLFFLGHDEPEYEVTLDWLQDRKTKLWIHCKNLEALDWMTWAPKVSGWHYFWHQEDDYTLTSNGIIWAYPGKPLSDRSICVMPERIDYTGREQEIKNCLGICSDYIGQFK